MIRQHVASTARAAREPRARVPQDEPDPGADGADNDTGDHANAAGQRSAARERSNERHASWKSKPDLTCFDHIDRSKSLDVRRPINVMLSLAIEHE